MNPLFKQPGTLITIDCQTKKGSIKKGSSLQYAGMIITYAASTIFHKSWRLRVLPSKTCLRFDLCSLRTGLPIMHVCFIPDTTPLTNAEINSPLCTTEMLLNGVVVKYNQTGQYFKRNENHFEEPAFKLVSDRKAATIFKSDYIEIGRPERNFPKLNLGKPMMADFSIFASKSKITRDMITIEEINPKTLKHV